MGILCLPHCCQFVWCRALCVRTLYLYLEPMVHRDLSVRRLGTVLVCAVRTETTVLFSQDSPGLAARGHVVRA